MIGLASLYDLRQLFAYYLEHKHAIRW